VTKTRIAVAAAAGLLLALPATAASAAYEDDVVTPENVPTTVEPGGTLTGTVSFATDCVPWAATLTQDSNDELLGSDSQNGGTEFTFSIPVPDVEDGTVATLRVECTYDDGLGPEGDGDEPQTLSGTTSPEAVTQASFVVPTALQTATAFETRITITADAGSGGGDDNGNGGGSGSAGGGSDASGALPDTGGSNASLLAVGGALVVAGAGVTIVARRRMGAKG